ncbi:MAG: hypothetical protein ABIH37_01720 [archaeon]
MKTLTILILCVFALGFLSAILVSSLVSYYDIESPFLIGLGIGDNTTHAPSDYIEENSIFTYDDRVVIYVKDASLSRYAPTGSMIPVLNENSNGIRVEVDSIDDINVGDIITFRSENILISHRVIEKGADSNGTYFITKGDNSPISDGKIRFEQIEHKTIGVIW